MDHIRNQGCHTGVSRCLRMRAVCSRFVGRSPAPCGHFARISPRSIYFRPTCGRRWRRAVCGDLTSAFDFASELIGVKSLSEVVDPNILVAYAQAEVAVKKNPWTIITFTPRPVIASDASAPGVPRPFEDFEVGDIVFARIDRGSVQVGTNGNPQATRVFGFTLDLDDSGVERLTSVQTTYQGMGGG